jgi:hypothetical protein
MSNIGEGGNSTLDFFGVFSLTMTDFSILNPQRFSIATLIVSLLALFSSFLQWGIVKIIDDDKNKAGGSVKLTAETQS